MMVLLGLKETKHMLWGQVISRFGSCGTQTAGLVFGGFPGPHLGTNAEE